MVFAGIRTTLIWLVVLACLLVTVTLPVNMQTQLIAGFVVFSIMAAIKMLKATGTWRLVALALGMTIILRYVYWRTTSTLPPLNQPQDFIPGFLLYLAEIYNVMMLLLSLFVVAMPLPSRPFRTIGTLEQIPQVDVFVPTYNEDATLLANTLSAAKAMDYPHDKVQVWLLDDGGTDQKRNSNNLVEAKTAVARYTQLHELCEELGVRYLTRERNEHAKAGNLNNGMKHSTGELIAVFDADHAPAREFLTETVGYFADDPKLFLVQTPHFFINPDPIERNLRTFEHMPSENEMFYGIIQRGLDKWNASFFCGSAAVLRREALETTHGFSGISITEDCETALELHASGWNSVYVDRPLVAGLQPATFASFIGQRSRWAQGMIQILMFRFPPLKRGLTVAQRLCYMSSTLFWLFPFSRTMFLFAPLFYLFFDLKIFTASGGEFLAYTLAYMLVNLMIQNYLFGSFRWPWISELYEYVQTIHLLPAVTSALINPRKPSFKVTAKDESIKVSRLSEISRPFFVIFAVQIIALALTIYRVYAEPYKADITLVVGGWNVFNLILSGCALGAVSERGERQSSRRVQVQRRCQIQLNDVWHDGWIENVSVNGAALRVFNDELHAIDRGSDALIRFQIDGDTEMATLPVNIRDIQTADKLTRIGCKYAPTSAHDHRMIADLIFANADQWTQFQQSRRRNPGVIRGTLQFLSLSAYQTSRGLVYLFRSLRPESEAEKTKQAEGVQA
ncbi:MULTISPECIES: UDP-forming cellulose synthase catalytic subunit [Alphaproteobacteria]|uniref:Cellulose synthase catalytic subunit [UDP-forming] n=2 Tax=Alphaproteobacteria TaxID=28211 RepID=A0A512HNP1_9HYPH|nr:MULTISPECIES: UDP-forming cellulose synthase catalytic subunit [Alphaproteobacteria]GEO87010.1 cellulose synthase catalytic subunit (UDP-forming) [Ciceribacter naphthalenivorans]GLR21614.1 cellulose synthase catalytic subunit (UDP-forming) [Ciceribacter naphthalenivorans]GLT04470.1 cellulose synthase catalytic subunit (UDP-forming) [Sphingomonas psychrolutea]